MATATTTKKSAPKRKAPVKKAAPKKTNNVVAFLNGSVTDPEGNEIYMGKGLSIYPEMSRRWDQLIEVLKRTPGGEREITFNAKVRLADISLAPPLPEEASVFAFMAKD